MKAILRYDGKYDWIPNGRQWTIMSHFIGPDGADYYRSSRMIDGLRELGIVQ